MDLIKGDYNMVSILYDFTIPTMLKSAWINPVFLHPLDLRYIFEEDRARACHAALFPGRSKAHHYTPLYILSRSCLIEPASLKQAMPFVNFDYVASGHCVAAAHDRASHSHGRIMKKP